MGSFPPLIFLPWRPSSSPERAAQGFGDAHWREVRGWNADAYRAGRRDLVVCAPKPDVFEDSADLDNVRRLNLWPLIRDTPHLDWQLVTKRPKNVLRLLPAEWREKLPGNLSIKSSGEDGLGHQA
jgi:protein gp37